MPRRVADVVSGGDRMNGLRVCFNHSEDQFPLPAEVRSLYGPFGFPPLPEGRPYISANFVQSLDGLVSFRDVPGKTSGAFISRSEEDRWLMAFLRAHHDAQFLGASTLRSEQGPDGRGWNYGALTPEWLAYRKRALGREKSIVIVVSRSGDIDGSHRLFHSAGTEAWVATTETGAARLQESVLPPAVEVIVPNSGDSVVPLALAEYLRRERGIRTLLCEAGPELYSQFFSASLIDEEFRTISAQVIGREAADGVMRPAAYEGPPFVPETAPWLRLISLHYALPSHVFLRMRYRGAAL